MSIDRSVGRWEAQQLFTTKWYYTVVVRWTLISVIGQVENQNFYRWIFECGRFNLLLNNFTQQADAVYCGRQGDFNFSNWARRVSKFLTRVKYAMKVILNES